jgi:superfamily I DNA/RNA helicase
MSATWSNYQNAIFDFAQHGQGNAIVEAVAGSGKTTTIVEAINRIQGSSIFLAFNKSIAEELKTRGVNARTFHSLTYSPVTRARMTNSVETNKLRHLTKQNLSQDDDWIYGQFAARLVGLARQVGIGCLEADDESAWYDIIQHHDLELENERAEMPRAVEIARKLLMWSNASNLVDFDDMLYFAVKDGIVLPKFDFIFVDEAQDTNAIQRAILRKIMHAHTRIIAVGDPAQAIYGFRGADSNSLNLIAEEFNCTRFPLTVSYRCAKSVVNHARKWVSHIEPCDDAPEGEVLDLGYKWDHTAFGIDDLVVCRNTKPLIQLAYRLLKARVPVSVMGREIGQGLKVLINRMKANGVDDLELKLEAWAMREVDKAIAKQLDSKADAVQDKCDAILCLLHSMDEETRTIEALLAVIDSLFTDGGRRLKLATIHKAKGLEASRVFWLNSPLCPAKWAKQEWQKGQEINLCYVAATRAKHTLVLIEDGKKA